MTTVEKLGRVISPEAWSDPAGTGLPEKAANRHIEILRHDALRKATAVLRALLEPSEGMVQTLLDSDGADEYAYLGSDGYGYLSDNAPARIFTAMIQAALDEVGR